MPTSATRRGPRARTRTAIRFVGIVVSEGGLQSTWLHPPKACVRPVWTAVSLNIVVGVVVAPQSPF
jgi:protein-S-isoprenylcysteine O-methyltransferase Ste14